MGEHLLVTDDEKNPADRALELLLFAPLGLALSARDLLPQLVERGRQQVTGQVTMAKMLGQFAVKQGTVEAEKAFDRARTQAQTALEHLGVLDEERATGPTPASPKPTAPTPAPTSPTSRPSTGTTVRRQTPVPVLVRDERTRPASPSLAIPDYDSLSASQVLPRLSSLTAGELEAVRTHEATNRGRKTILSKVAQLQAS